MRWLSRARATAPAQRPRHARRLRRRLVLAGLAATMLAVATGAAVWLAPSGLAAQAEASMGARLAGSAKDLGFAIANVSVEGRERETRKAILEALGVKRGAPILALDLAAAKARLEALPWVRAAEIERLLPDTIFVRIAERRPLAFWQRQGKLVLIADDGKIIPAERLNEFGALVVLVGDDAPPLGGALLDMLATEPALFPHVAAAVRVGGRRWNIRLDSGIDVSLPERDPESAWHRLAALDRSESLLGRNIVAVDLRLPDRLVLRLPPEPPKRAPAKKAKPAGKST
jgi:cell division protein FtsQ